MKNKKGKLLIVVNGREWWIDATYKDYDRIISYINHGVPCCIDYLTIGADKIDSVCWLRLPKEER